MTLVDTLKAVEADIASIGTVSEEIRQKVKDGLAEIALLRDEATTTVESLVSRARASLLGLKAAAEGANEAVPLPAPAPPDPAAPAGS